MFLLVLFVVSEHPKSHGPNVSGIRIDRVHKSKCHAPDEFGIRINRVDIRNVMAQ